MSDWRNSIRRLPFLGRRPTRVVAATGDPQSDDFWYGSATDGTPTVRLYYFFSPTCPHCQAAKPFIAELQARNAWLEVRRYSVKDHRGNARFYYETAQTLGAEVVKLQGDDVAAAILRFARERGVTLALVGQSRRSRWFSMAVDAKWSTSQVAEVAGCLSAHTICPPRIAWSNSSAASLSVTGTSRARSSPRRSKRWSGSTRTTT